MLRELKENAKFLLDELNTRVKISNFAEESIIKGEDGKYYYPYNGDKSSLSFLSDGCVRYFDKETLLDKEKRHELGSVRSLRIAASHLLTNATLLVVLDYELRSLVKYKSEDQEYIIDYGNNLVMKKRDYDKIFSYQVIESIAQHEMPYLNDVIEYLSYFIQSDLAIVFYTEIKKSLSGKNTGLFRDKYFSGIHANNRYMLDLGAESLFMTENEKWDIWEKDADVIYSFTLDPLSRNFPITVTEDDYFLYKDYKFRRLSDYTNFEPYKEELLSEKRYHKCMLRSLNVLFNLAKTLDKDNIRLVIGKIPINEYESFYHAWIEFKSKSLGCYIAIDYTGNLVMRSDDFRRLRNAKVIRVLPYDLLNELFSYYDEALIGVDKFPTLFFAEEFLRDYKKNKSLFKGMQ